MKKILSINRNARRPWPKSVKQTSSNPAYGGKDSWRQFDSTSLVCTRTFRSFHKRWNVLYLFKPCGKNTSVGECRTPIWHSEYVTVRAVPTEFRGCTKLPPSVSGHQMYLDQIMPQPWSVVALSCNWIKRPQTTEFLGFHFYTLTASYCVVWVLSLKDFDLECTAIRHFVSSEVRSWSRLPTLLGRA